MGGLWAANAIQLLKKQMKSYDISDKVFPIKQGNVNAIAEDCFWGMFNFG